MGVFATPESDLVFSSFVKSGKEETKSRDLKVLTPFFVVLWDALA